MSISAAPAETLSETVPLKISDLSVTFQTSRETVAAVKSVTYSVAPGEVLAVVGESGSGKSVTALAALGLLAPNAKTSGTISIQGADILAMPERQRETIRGRDIAMVFQDPMNSLNPTATVGAQIVEAIRLHTNLSPSETKAHAIDLMGQVGLPDPTGRFNYYPHQLSGGQRQRVVIAIAISCNPRVLIADEPTTALDVTVQAEILDLLRRLCRDRGTSMVLITHNMGVVADIADRVIVMRKGEIVETASVQELFANPQHAYSRKLLDAVPRLNSISERPSVRIPAAAAARTGNASEVALKVTELVVDFKGASGSVFRALDKVSFDIAKGEVFGLIGESGSGKSTVGRCAAGLLVPSSGTVQISGKTITGMSYNAMRPLRRNFAMVFQDPAASLDPRQTVAQNIAEPLIVHGLAKSGKLLRSSVLELLDKVELEAKIADRYPFELSGGQKQRVSIARALSLQPDVLIADEPTSALDVSVQARVLEIFKRLQTSLHFSCLFISHDLAVVESLCSHIAVMRKGRVVEMGETSKVLSNPQESYTRALLAAVPVPDPALQRARREARAFVAV